MFFCMFFNIDVLIKLFIDFWCDIYVYLELVYKEVVMVRKVVEVLMVVGFKVMIGVGKIGVVVSLKVGNGLCLIGLWVDMDVLFI